jgi:hypothetical protein
MHDRRAQEPGTPVFPIGGSVDFDYSARAPPGTLAKSLQPKEKGRPGRPPFDDFSDFIRNWTFRGEIESR